MGGIPFALAWDMVRPDPVAGSLPPSFAWDILEQLGRDRSGSIDGVIVEGEVMAAFFAGAAVGLSEANVRAELLAISRELQAGRRVQFSEVR